MEINLIMGKLGLSLLTIGLVLALSACGFSTMGVSSSSGEQSYTSTSTCNSEGENYSKVQKTTSKNQDDFANMIESCGDEAMTSGNEGSEIKSTVSFETNCIKVYCDEDEFATPIEITDISIISEITNAIDVSAWEKVDLENEIPATPAYYIDFCNGTVLSMLADVGYGSVGTGLCTEYDENGNLSSFGLENGGETYYYNDGLYEVIGKVLAEDR